MKSRQGFVSNSSSSSFLIYGRTLDEEDLELIESLKELPKDIEIIYGQEIKYLGCSWDRIGNDETRREFQERIETSIKEIYKHLKLTIPEHFSTYNESWYNG